MELCHGCGLIESKPFHLCSRCYEKYIHRYYWKDKAFNAVGKGIIRCMRCGCNRLNLLQIHHKNGDGHIDRGHYNERVIGKRKTLLGTTMYHAIVSGRRTTEDLEILCYPCNALEFLESKFGILPFSITWTG